jgi:acyl-CoA thioester hydrolase
MLSSEILIRVSYSDTDQMGYMHHSNYLKYYESARWDLFRSIGMPYKGLENEDIILPVVEASLKFVKPAFYDQQVRIVTTLKSLKGARISFAYLATNEAGDVLNEAFITVACVKKSSGKACLPPKRLVKTLNIYLKKNDQHE